MLKSLDFAHLLLPNRLSDVVLSCRVVNSEILISRWEWHFESLQLQASHPFSLLAENEKNQQVDVWRFDQVCKATAKPNHPYRKFVTGLFFCLSVCDRNGKCPFFCLSASLSFCLSVYPPVCRHMQGVVWTLLHDKLLHDRGQSLPVIHTIVNIAWWQIYKSSETRTIFGHQILSHAICTEITEIACIILILETAAFELSEL